MARRANYRVEKATQAYMLLTDLGPWDQYLTIANAAEQVVAEVRDQLGKRRLFYRDSDGELTELALKDGKFETFAPAKEMTLWSLDRVPHRTGPLKLSEPPLDYDEERDTVRDHVPPRPGGYRPRGRRS